jgi:hypothetical protein
MFFIKAMTSFRWIWGILFFVVFVLHNYLCFVSFVEQLENDLNVAMLLSESFINANQIALERSNNLVVSTTSDNSAFSVLLTVGGVVLAITAVFLLFGIVVDFCYPQPIYLPYDSWLSFHLKANSACSIYLKWLPVYNWKLQSLKYYLDYYIQIWSTHDNPAADQLPEVIITLGQKYQQMLDFQHCGYKVLQYVCASDPGAVNRLTPKDLDLFFKTLEHSQDITDFILVSKKVANADAFGVINKLFT